ncbi:MAG TPA: hypothetical protein VKZ18_04335 [Polyangia bacterium]|nr:hypothetical protein [Polyangia bacterium]
MTRTRVLFPALIAVLAMGSCRGGCRRGEDRAATVEGRLALFPVATKVVAAIDVARLRASPAAAKLSEKAQQDQGDAREIAEFARRTGFDPLRQLGSVTVAFPEEARLHGEMGLVLRADDLDEARLVAYARDQLQKSGDDLVATAHGRFTLWSSKRDPDLVAFFIDRQTFALGAGGWGPRMADLAESARPVDSAATDVDLTNLVERAAGAHAIWAAAIVPESTRKSLSADPRFADAASILTLSAGIDLGKGLDAQLLADLATAAEAKSLALKVTEATRDARRNPQVLMLGIGPYLDGVTATAKDHTFDLRATLNEAAFDDLLARLGGLLALMRGGGAVPIPVPAPPPPGAVGH